VVWRFSKTYEDSRERLAYLSRALNHFKQFKGEEKHYRWLPVDPQTFVESTEMLNQPGVLYPSIRNDMFELNGGRYVEAVLTGGIGTGKTTLALYTTAYQLYVLSCLHSPQRTYRLDPSSEIMFIFQSLNKLVAKTVEFERFKSAVRQSPYFSTKFPYRPDIESELLFPKRIIVRPLSGDVSAAIGQNVFGGIIDEVNFMAVVEKSKNAIDGGVFDQANEMYNTIVRRRKSRFMQGGKLPGMLCLVSSKRYPGEFTDIKIDEAKNDPSIFVFDKRVWDVKPDAFSGEWFHIFVGDVSRRPRILESGEETTIPEEDQRLVMAVPEEYRTEFERDMLSSLRDIAGVSTLALYPFVMQPDKVAACFGKVPSVLSRPDTDFASSQVLIYPKRFVNLNEPRWVHLDLSKTGDATGVAIGHVPRFQKVARAEGHYEWLPVIRFDAILEVRPPKNSEIIYDKIRALLYKLREVGLPLRWASADQYQSADTLQLLNQKGFLTGLRSLDESNRYYEIAKLAFYDGRVEAPEHDKAQTEFVRLEIDPKTGKIDHPVNYSKDCSDAVAGVISGLTLATDVWVGHGVPISEIPHYLRRSDATETPAREAPDDPQSYTERLRRERLAS